MLKGRRAHILSIGLLFTVMFMVFGGGSARGQRVYADADSPFSGQSGTKGTSTFTNPAGGPATMTIVSNLGLFPATQTGWITLKFSTSIPTGKTVFIKVNAINSNVIAQAYNGTTAITTSQTITFKTIEGDFYYAVNANSTFDRIRVTATAPAALLGSSTNATIYYPFYESSCSPVFTSITGASILASISNPNNAIDGNLSSPSQFSVTLGLGSTISQNIYYSTLSNELDEVTLTLAIPPAAISAGVLGNISIKAYNGTSQAGSISFQSLLQGTDLLTLLNSGAVATIKFIPQNKFNRVELSMTSLLSLATTLNLYEVKVTPPKPSLVTASNIAICEGATATLTASSPGNTIKWYDQQTDGNLLATGSSLTVSPIATENYYVTSVNSCAIESERVLTTVVVNPLPPHPITIVNSH